MSNLWRLVKVALLGGLGILLPILLLFLILEEVLDLAVAIAEPVADLLLPERVLGSASGPFAGALGFLAGALIPGLVAKTNAGNGAMRLS